MQRPNEGHRNPSNRPAQHRRQSLRGNLFYERFPWFPHRGRVGHISLVFREIWDSTDVDR
jgi:hypothetical protein